MQIEIQARGISVTEAIERHVKDRMEAALGQYAGRVTDVAVAVSDLNARRGGVDKSCVVTASLRPRGQVRVEEADSDLYAAVSHAADRVKVAVGKAIEKRRDRRTAPPPPPPPTTTTER